MATAATRRRRSWPRRLLILAALLLGAFFALRALLQPERLGAFLLQQARDATGLTLETTGPAQLGLWPDLHLELDGLSARVAPDAPPLLQAERIEAVLPWSSLRATTLQLRSLRMQRATLDLAALQAWLPARNDAGPPAPLRLPQLESALSVEDGRVIGDGWRIEALQLWLPHWRNGIATRVALAGRIERAEATPLPFSLQLDATPQAGPDGVRLDPFAIALLDPVTAVERATFTGRVAIPDTTQLQLGLAGELSSWPQDWPPLPLPDADGEPLRLQLDYNGSTAFDGEAQLRIARGDERIDARLRANALAAWLDGSDTSWLPPLQGDIEATRLRLGGTELHGVKVRIGEDESDDAKRED